MPSCDIVATAAPGEAVDDDPSLLEPVAEDCALPPLVKPSEATAPVAAAPTADAAPTAAAFASSKLVGTAAATLSETEEEESAGRPESLLPLPPFNPLFSGFDELMTDGGVVRESSKRDGVAPMPLAKPEA
jgi:hypothetical protein